MRLRVLLAVVLPGSLVLGSILPASASPVCADPPREICGGRIFPEAENAVSFLQHDNGEYEDGIKALAEEFPRFVRVRSLTDIRGRESLSAGGREMWVVEITDFDAPEAGKRPVVVSLSVHGPERAGLEGGARYAEDLARWATDEPDHVLRNGTEPDSTEMPVSEVLRKVHLYLTNLNPDGWAAGDVANGGVFVRGNDNGVDLNREFPTKGWTKVSYTPLSEPESIAWDDVVRDIAPVTASDLHGELTSANNVYADIMLPAGQWNPLEQAREERLARHMKSNIEWYFEDQGVPTETGFRPAEYATGYDVVGYDDSGFMGDYFTEQLGATEVDVEHLFSHMVPNSTWAAPHEDAHIAAVRGEIETLMVEAIVLDDVDVRLKLGTVGYLFDPYVVKSSDGYGGPQPPDGVDPRGYRVTHMRYFRDLARFATERFRKVESGNISGRKLGGLDSFVVAGDPFPRDPDGERVNKSRIARTLKAFVKGGGNLVLTDGGLKLLSRMKIVKKGDIQRTVHNAGHIDIEDFDDKYLKKVHTTASQTYYEVPLGYSVDQDSAPHVTVAREAWEGAGGKSFAYITDEARIGLGRLKLGKGTIGILGALLPRPTEAFDHFFGLSNYAVTVTGGQILNNMLAAGR
jgi:hypothetical protein